MTPTKNATLQAIANWQLNPEASGTLRVELPKLQRGFVWEPSRIINLWDSLLRGFPIGSLLLSEMGDKDFPENQTSQYWLLDGQQRATSITMGFYNPWERHVDSTDASTKQAWSLKVIPVLWIDLLPERSDDEDKLFFPHLVTQSHPWGYRQSGAILAWGDRSKALKSFASVAGHCRYTSFALKNVYPWKANLPVPMAFLLRAPADCLSNDVQYKAFIDSQCQHLPDLWHSRFASQFKEFPTTCLAALREANRSITDYCVHLNYLNFRARANDSVDKDDNSILFVRLNTGGKELRGEELVFSLFKSAFPKAKDAVESAAAGFMPPSRLFSLLVRLVAAHDDVSKLHSQVSLRDFKVKITDGVFKERLEAFINTRVAEIVSRARLLLTGNHAYSLPAALATRTIKEAPDIFLALLHWLYRGGGVNIGSPEHRSLIAVFTALSWFAPGNARQKQENLRRWMEVAHTRAVGEFWQPESIRGFFVQPENPIPLFPDPTVLQDFLNSAIVKNVKYNWETLGDNCPEHPIFNGYTRLPMPVIGPVEAESGITPQLLRQRFMQQNLRSFIGILCWSTELLLFAQRHLLERDFQEFQQWDVVLDDTNCPWDWDHIYPSARFRHNVDPKYREWHDTIGNKRVEELAHNRQNGASLPKDKLADPNERVDSFISGAIWDMIQAVDADIKNTGTAETLCRIILTRMVEIYREWYATFGIGDLMT